MIKFFKVLSVLAFVGLAASSAQGAMTDGEFELLLEKLPSRSALYEIAYSGHPRSLTVLRELREANEDAKEQYYEWRDFKDKYGYPKRIGEGPDDWKGRGNFAFDPKTLDNALAAAGDEEAFDEIVDGYDGAGGIKKAHILERLKKVRSDAAVRFVASKLFDESIGPVFPIAFSAATVLAEFADDAEIEAFPRGDESPESIRNWINSWKDWWREHAREYGASPPQEGESPSTLEMASGESEGQGQLEFDVPKGGSKEEAVDAQESQSEGAPWLWIASAVVAVCGLVFWLGRKRGGPD